MSTQDHLHAELRRAEEMQEAGCDVSSVAFSICKAISSAFFRVRSSGDMINW